MAARKHDREAIVAEFLEARAAQPTLSLKAFCKQKGLPYKYVSKTIGRQMVDAWDRVVTKARHEVEKKMGSTLASSLQRMAKQHEGLIDRAMEKLTPPAPGDRSRPGAFEPTDHEGALEQVRTGTSGFIAAVSTLTGRQPMIPPEDVPYETEWSPPIKRTLAPLRAAKVGATSPKNGRAGNGKVNGKRR